MSHNTIAYPGILHHMILNIHHKIIAYTTSQDSEYTSKDIAHTSQSNISDFQTKQGHKGQHLLLVCYTNDHDLHEHVGSLSSNIH